MFVGCDDKEIHKVESSWKVAICFAHHQGFPARELPRRTCDSVYTVKHLSQLLFLLLFICCYSLLLLSTVMLSTLNRCWQTESTD